MTLSPCISESRKSVHLKTLFQWITQKRKRMMIEELFWMIEEYKVSLFAQELKTPYPVSPKKLNQLIEEIEKL